MTGRERDIWTITGECSTCPDYFYAGPNKHECFTDPCDDETDFKQLDGTCLTCPENYYPKQIDLKCEQETCDPRSQYVNKKGRCETCEEGTHPFANETFRGCLRSCPYGIAENNVCPCPDGQMPDNGWCGVRYHRIHIWGRQIPTYSYVYTYKNMTTGGNITYPEYNITTTKWANGTYVEGEGWSCPCDLDQFTTGTQDVNHIIE
jgi:hypothetical protein